MFGSEDEYEIDGSLSSACFDLILMYKIIARERKRTKSIVMGERVLFASCVASNSLADAQPTTEVVLIVQNTCNAVQPGDSEDAQFALR